jgi:hypothetical protein
VDRRGHRANCVLADAYPQSDQFPNSVPNDGTHDEPDTGNLVPDIGANQDSDDFVSDLGTDDLADAVSYEVPHARTNGARNSEPDAAAYHGLPNFKP